MYPCPPLCGQHADVADDRAVVIAAGDDEADGLPLRQRRDPPPFSLAAVASELTPKCRTAPSRADIVFRSARLCASSVPSSTSVIRSTSSASSPAGRNATRPVGGAIGVPGLHSKRNRSARSRAPVWPAIAIRSSTTWRELACSRQSGGTKRMYSGGRAPAGTISPCAAVSSCTPVLMRSGSPPTSRTSSRDGASAPRNPHQATLATQVKLPGAGDRPDRDFVLTMSQGTLR